MRPGTVVGGGLLVALGAAAGFLAGRWGQVSVETVRSDQRTEEASQALLLRDVERANAQAEDLRRAARAAAERADTAERERAGLEAELEELRASGAAPPSGADATGAAAAPADDAEPHPGGPRFPYAASREALEAVDWEAVGENMAALSPVLAELVEALAAGEPPPAAALGKVQQHNGPVLTQAMSLHGKVPGSSVNSAFTHPAVVVNTLAATLEALGMPLTDEQATALERLGARYGDEDRRREAAYGADVPQLRKTLDESELRHRFFAEVYPVLTDAQHAAARPEVTRGRIRADLFSEAMVWVMGAAPVPCAGRDEFAEKAVARVVDGLDLPEELRAEAGSVVDRWVAELPDSYFEFEPDALSRSGLLPASIVAAAAEQQLELMERLARIPDLEDGAVTALRTSGAIVLPIPR